MGCISQNTLLLYLNCCPILPEKGPFYFRVLELSSAGCTIVNTMVSSLCCIAKVEWKFEWSIEMLKLKTLCFSTISLRIANISRQSVANKQEKEVIFMAHYILGDEK